MTKCVKEVDICMFANSKTHFTSYLPPKLTVRSY
jgi:hypothetical protein